MKQLLVILLILPINLLLAQSNYDERLYHTFVLGDMMDWERVIDELQFDLKRKDNDIQRFKLLHAQYGYIGYLLGVKQNDRAKDFIVRAEENVRFLENSKKFKSAVKAIQSAILAYRISLSPYKAPFLGPKSMTLIDEALAINPNDVYAIIEKANAKHYAPSIVGGNLTEAIELYARALKALRDKNGGQHPKTWWYINAYTQMGLAAQKTGNIVMAKKIFIDLLQIEPQYKWVKNDLLPNLK